MVAGLWLLVSLPWVSALLQSHWADQIYVPTFFHVQARQSLSNTFLPMLHPYLPFCIGIVLLFSKERNRRAARLDVMRRWGVIGSYLILVLGIPPVAFITSLVISGIGALLQSLPRVQQPATTGLFVNVGTGYLFYGVHPSRLSDFALVVASNAIVLLACLPLYNAMRSSGSKAWAIALLTPLALVAAMQAASPILFALDLSGLTPRWIYCVPFFFDLASIIEIFSSVGRPDLGWSFALESAKWLACLAIATWLSVAQVAAIVSRGKSQEFQPTQRS